MRSPQYSYPSCATFNVLLALLNGVARLAQTRCQRCLLRHAVRCRAVLIAPIQKPTLRMAMGAEPFAANILCSTDTHRRKGLVVSVQARRCVMGAEHGCKRGTLSFFSLGQ
ncbi:hypothetical protein L210DRAFT_3574651 [Boletus edulis BED1]|uniref:Secreted protein n=1 Tax=Boletus edulis BED1 TaxID=1328754 RepID=A0AAD4G6D3_BOLED|nr:hypothetical protein L210DRAFT_3574651 [Boletus edulis BED1]